MEISGPIRGDDPGFVDTVTELWFRVSQADGAAGFVPTDTRDDIRVVAEAVIGAVRAGKADLLALRDADALLGIAVVERGQRPIRRHTAELTWLMVDPELHGRGWGKRLLAAAVRHAAGIGVTRMELSTRSGHGLEGFYTSQGWTERGRWPGAVRVADGDERDDIWFTRDI